MDATDSYMNAVRVHHPGGPEALFYEQAPRPRLRNGEVLVEVRAAAITPAEFLLVGKRYEADYSVTRNVRGGSRGSAPKVRGIELGDEVYGLPAFARDGAAAQYAAVRATELAPKPASIDHVNAAAIPLSALTAWQAFASTAR